MMSKKGLLTNQQVWEYIGVLTQQHGMYLSPNIIEQLRQKLCIAIQSH